MTSYWISSYRGDIKYLEYYLWILCKYITDLDIPRFKYKCRGTEALPGQCSKHSDVAIPSDVAIATLF